MNIGFISLGCAKNQVDTEIMMGLVKKAGYRIENRLERAEIIVINTCGFITLAQEEAIDTILETGQLKAQGQLKYLVVTGCLAQRYGESLRMELPEVDAFLGISTYLKLPEVLKLLRQGEKIFWIEPPPAAFIEYGSRVLATPKGYAYLKIAEGCNNRCSFCAIPGIRGNLRSHKVAALAEEARRLTKEGCRELVVISQDTASYGKDLLERQDDLSKLLVELNRLEDLKWIRVMYLHPHSITEELLANFERLEKVVPYFDVPVQHISDRILQKMNRKDRGEKIENTLCTLRKVLPQAVVRTTVMTGFPGETEKEFEELFDFVARMEFDWLGAFIYDPQEGTPAYNLPDRVSQEEAKRRLEKILALQQAITRKKNQARLNIKTDVLITQKLKEQLYLGRGYFQAPEVDGVTLVKSKNSLALGELAEVTLKAIRNYDMIGEID